MVVCQVAQRTFSQCIQPGGNLGQKNNTPDKHSINKHPDPGLTLNTEAHLGYPYDKWVSVEYRSVSSSEIHWAMCGYTHKHVWCFDFSMWLFSLEILTGNCFSAQKPLSCIRWYNRLCQAEGGRTLIDCAYWTQLRPIPTLNNSCLHYKHCFNCNNVWTRNFQRVAKNFFAFSYVCRMLKQVQQMR